MSVRLTHLDWVVREGRFKSVVQCVDAAIRVICGKQKERFPISELWPPVAGNRIMQSIRPTFAGLGDGFVDFDIIVFSFCAAASQCWLNEVERTILAWLVIVNQFLQNLEQIWGGPKKSKSCS